MAAAESFPDGGANESMAALAAELEAPHFDSEDVANTAIWPVVDKLSRRNWRQNAYPGLDFQFPYHDEGEEGLIDINLVACCEAVPVDSDEYEDGIGFVCSATLEIQVTAEDALREHIIDSAYDAWTTINSQTAEDYLREELVAKTAVSYTFNMDGEVFVSSTQEVSSIYDGELLWSNEWSDESYGEYRQKLYEDDLTKIGEALMMLADTAEYAEAIDVIKSRPKEEDKNDGE